MTSPHFGLAAIVFALGLALSPATSFAQAPAAEPAKGGEAPPLVTAAPERLVNVGYIELANDPRYASQGAYSGIQYFTLSRPWTGAEVGLDEANQVGGLLKIGFTLDRQTLPDVEAMANKVREWAAAGSNYVMLDLPAALIVQLADAVKDQPVVLFNISAADDTLRGPDCRANVLHTYPSEAMLQDSLAQYLVIKKWRNILVLQGPAPRDALMVQALQRSAQKFGLRIVEVRQALLSNDPNNREQTNIPLLTGGTDYDVVYIADDGFEIGRYIPYQTNLPRPVVGSAGLMPLAWHWSYDNDAAAQLQSRYEKKALPQRMNSEGWAAWEAMKVINNAITKTRGADFAGQIDYIKSDRLNLDTVKGNPGSFRSWDNQLRAPVVLATADASIARTPFTEFLHQTNDLDTLGVDAPETACRF